MKSRYIYYVYYVYETVRCCRMLIYKLSRPQYRSHQNKTQCSNITRDTVYRHKPQQVLRHSINMRCTDAYRVHKISKCGVYSSPFVCSFNRRFTEENQMVVTDVTPTNVLAECRMFDHLSSHVSSPACFGDWSPS